VIQTLNQHIKLFSDFATNHQQINSFDFGDPWEWYNSNKDNGEHLNYPAMFVAPGSTSVTEGLHTRTYTVFFCDLVRHAEQNEDDVLSDMELIALDFLSFMVKGDVGAQVSNRDASLNPFTERGVDYLAGYEISITIRQQFEYEDCNIPMSGISVDYVSCRPVTIYDTQTGSTITTVNSGGSYGVIQVSIISGGGASTTFSNTIIAS
jgi:hypothetical protein